MAPIFHQQQMDHHAHHAVWEDGRQARSGTHYPLQQHQHQHHQHQHQHQQWPAQGRLHINPAMVRDDGFAAAPPMQQHHGSMSASRHHQPQQQSLGSSSAAREVLGEGSFMGRGYSIKRCQGFVRCDMDIDAEVVGWVIGKNGSTIKDMKHKTGCNMWVDQRALKLTITGPDLPSVEHAAKSVDAYVAAAPIKAGAVEAAVTKTIECPPQLLDDLGDRTTIARIVKETHAQVVVNKKIGRIIVRGDHRSVDLAYESVRAMIHNAVHGSYGLGVRVSTPESHGSFGVASGGGAGYFPDGTMSSSGRGGGGGGGGGGGDMRSPLVSGAVAGATAGMHHLMLPSTAGGDGGSSHVDPDFHHLGGSDYRHARDTAEFHHLATWQQEQQQLELKPEHSHQPLQRHHHHHHHERGVGSDTDDSEIETVSLGSIGARTPVSSTAGSPRVVGSYNTSPALSGTASTPVGDWSLFSGGFGIGMAALQEGESSTSRSSTPTTARTTPRVHFPEGLRALVGGAAGASAASAGDNAVLKGSGLLSPASAAGGNSGGSSNGGGGKPAGSLAPPPSPSSTAGGEASRRMAGPPEAQVLSALEGQASDGEEEHDEEQEGSAAAGGGGGEDISDKVARLGKVLQTMGLGKYCLKFAENEVDLEALGLMSESDLADIGIPKGPRLKILNAVGARPAAAAAANHAPAV
ncbi:unnamed protein product [Ectocarpus sp. 13 AM-2016]